MKCIHCNNDAKYKDRSDGKCPTCGRPFAFEPQSGHSVTDAAFKSAIDRVSSGGTVKWTTDHLYYEVAKRKRRTMTATVTLGIVGGGLLVVGVFLAPALAVMGVVLCIVAVLAVPSRVLALQRPTFDGLLHRWTRVHGDPPALIVRKALPKAAATRPLPTDIHEYSFDRAVICDRPETVDLLLANNFHFENNCAVLSADGYPPHAFDTVRAMLRKNPKLVAYVVHDATTEGCALGHRLASDKEWFQSGARIVDVGLRPRHARAFKGCWRPAQTLDLAAEGHLSRSERAWLTRYSLALAAIRPEQVIKRLFRAISRTPESFEAESAALPLVDAAAFDGDATVSDGGGDSFG